MRTAGRKSRRGKTNRLPRREPVRKNMPLASLSKSLLQCYTNLTEVAVVTFFAMVKMVKHCKIDFGLNFLSHAEQVLEVSLGGHVEFCRPRQTGHNQMERTIESVEEPVNAESLRTGKIWSSHVASRQVIWSGPRQCASTGVARSVYRESSWTLQAVFVQPVRFLCKGGLLCKAVLNTTSSVGLGLDGLSHLVSRPED